MNSSFSTYGLVSRQMLRDSREKLAGELEKVEILGKKKLVAILKQSNAPGVSGVVESVSKPCDKNHQKKTSKQK